MSEELKDLVNSEIEALAKDTPEESEEAETPAITEVPEASSLTPEHIEHLLKVLGDDIIVDMLESAGLTEEDLENALDDEQEDGEKDSASAEAPAAGRKPRRKGKAKRRLLFVLIFIGIILLVAAVNKIFMSVTINTNAPIQYSESIDDISADEGSLNVNNVSVSVPTDGTEEYSISYSWAEDDDKYPSVPHAITAIYSGKAEESEEEGGEESGPAKLYSISLYRNDITPSKSVKKGKKASNWFDDWAVVNEGDVLQVPLKSGSINGFYVFPQPPADGETASEYNDFSYYFAVKDKEGISTYVLEGVCLDPERDAEFRTIMDNCIHSITIK